MVYEFLTSLMNKLTKSEVTEILDKVIADIKINRLAVGKNTPPDIFIIMLAQEADAFIETKKLKNSGEVITCV